MKKTAALLAMALAVPPSWGVSMRVSPASLVVSSGGGSIEVENMDQKALVRVRMIMRPPRADELLDGYEPFGDLSRAVLHATEMTLGPGERKKPALSLRLPSEKTWAAGQYQLEWDCEGTDSKGEKLLLSSALLLQPPEEEPHGAGQSETPGGEAFALNADEGKAENVPLGRAVDPGPDGGLKIVNESDGPAAFLVRVKRPQGEEGRQDEGFDPSPNPHFLEASPSRIQAPANEIKPVRLRLRVPEERRYRGRRWFFDVAVSRAEMPSTERLYRLFVTTEGEK